MSAACCDRCLRRAYLIAMLAPGITSALRDPDKRRPALLALPDEVLVATLAEARQTAAERFLEGFDPAAAREMAETAALGIVCRHDPRFPEAIRELADPPAALFHTGPLARLVELAERTAVTIVGARRASAHGLELARELGKGAARAGATVVSGLALGIDGAAHRGALEAGGPAIAVLAGGADRPYPVRHRRLYERLVATGTVLSELPPGTPPYRWAFPARNRIMAALGKLTIIVEAEISSGTKITADFAADLHRDIGAVPGRVGSPLAGLSNMLIREWRAALIRGVEDMLDELFGAGARPEGWQPGGRAHDIAGLEPFDRAVLAAVEEGLSVGAISEASDAPAHRVRATLARLELLDLVRSDGLGAYQATAAG